MTEQVIDKTETNIPVETPIGTAQIRVFSNNKVVLFFWPDGSTYAKVGRTLYRVRLDYERRENGSWQCINEQIYSQDRKGFWDKLASENAAGKIRSAASDALEVFKSLTGLRAIEVAEKIRTQNKIEKLLYEREKLMKQISDIDEQVGRLREELERG